MSKKKNELVFINNGEMFTDSKIIADGTNNQHRSLKILLNRHEKEFSELGKVSFEMTPLSSGQHEKIYILNEPQASFLIMLSKNTEQVIKFKLRLVKEFYRMRKILVKMLVQKQNEEWMVARKEGKLIRRNETDAIQNLIPYAMAQGSHRMVSQGYMLYSKACQ